MDTLAEHLSFPALLESLTAYLYMASTWWQIAVIGSGLVAAWVVGQYLQSRLEPVIQPGVMTGIRRVAMRTGVLVLVPLIWWLWLLAANALMRRLGQPTDLLLLAIQLVGALTLIRMGVFVLRHTFSPGSKLKAWEGALTVTIWGLVALDILGWLPIVQEILNEYAVSFGSTRISLYTVASFVLSIALLLLAALWVANGVQSLLRKSQAMDESMKVVLVNVTRFLFLTLAVLAAMVAAGIDLTVFAVFGGALGVGLGLGLQRIVSNFVSGVILAFEGSIRPGDVISIGDSFGTVKSLQARHVVVRTRDGLDILVPNESLLTSEITNWSYGDRNVRLKLPVQVSYQDDPEQVIALLEQAALSHPRVLKDPKPTGCLKGFGDNGIDMELRAWVNDPEHGVGNVRSEINRRIWRELRAAGVTIPFPQRDLYVKEMPAAAPARRAGKPGSRAGSARGRRRGPKAETPG